MDGRRKEITKERPAYTTKEKTRRQQTAIANSRH